jgi:luciferase-type oxidoreductase
LNAHPGYSRVFGEGRLTIGFNLPLEAYPDGPAPTLANHGELVKKAEAAGVAALWLRDVPFYDPGFGDVGQVLDPMVYAGWIAGITQRVTIGTAGIIAPLRHPLLVAKQAASADHLLGGRFVLGLASGDRAAEYPAFGTDFGSRTARYRDATTVIKTALGEPFARHQSQMHGRLDGSLDLIPKPPMSVMPIIAIGRAGQELSWLAEHTDAWLWHGADASGMTDILPAWREASRPFGFRPFGYGTWFDLDARPDAPVQRGRLLRAGRIALIELLERQQQAGVSHVIFNLKHARRPINEILDEMAEFVLPRFKAG